MLTQGGHLELLCEALWSHQPSGPSSDLSDTLLVEILHSACSLQSALDDTQCHLALGHCAWSAALEGLAAMWVPHCPWAGTRSCQMLGMCFGPDAGLLDTVPAGA